MYLNYTSKIGIKFNVDEKNGFECYADADLQVDSTRIFLEMTQHEPSLVLGGTSSMQVVPLSWHLSIKLKLLSVLQRLSISLCQLIEEIKQCGFLVLCTLAYIYCKALEDNSGTLEVARLPKMRSFTEYIAVCYHQFREHLHHRR
ncbi:hypothetical protein ACHAXS_000359 [Conticribra weissflogii]